MKLNIKTKLAANQDAELIPVDAFTIFEIAGYKFFSHHDDTHEYLSDDRWKCSEYSTGLSITWGEYHTEDEAIENAKYIITKRPDLTNDISTAIEQYGYANKED